MSQAVGIEQLKQEQKNRVQKTDRTLPTNKISNTYRGLKVLGLVADTTACGYYRVINPLHMLGQMGATVHYSSHHGLEEFRKYDIILAPRQHSPEVYEILRSIQFEDKIVIFELDDDLDAVLKDSPAYATYHPGAPETEWIHKFIANAHGFTTTTLELAKWYSQSNQNVRVLGNFIDFSLRDWHANVTWNNGNPIITPKPIEKPKEWEGYRVIEYSFGSTHNSDIKLLGPTFKNLLEKYDDIIIALYSSIESVEFFRTQFNIKSERMLHIPARHYLDHPPALFGADIQLAPLVGCQFNVAKSPLKFLESAAAGAAVIGTNLAPYARLAREHPGIFNLVGSGKDCHRSWEEAISYLLDNPDVRREQQIKGRQLVFDEYSLERNVHLWPQAWKSINEYAHKGLLGPPDNKKSSHQYKSYGNAKPKDPCPCGSGLSYSACCRDAWG